MTPSLEIFDLGLHRRAFLSSADRERAGFLAELTHADISPMQSVTESKISGEWLAQSVFQLDMS